MKGARGENRMPGNGCQSGQTFVLMESAMGKGKEDINTPFKKCVNCKDSPSTDMVVLLASGCHYRAELWLFRSQFHPGEHVNEV